MVKISPSLLAADFKNLEKSVQLVDKGGADYIHIDVMDGNFVPNISFGTVVMDGIRDITDKILDVHLMVIDPDKFVECFVKSGADIITVHQESTIHLHRTIQLIKSFGIKASVAINPATNLDTIEYVLEEVDMVLIMSVNPGFGGQKFIKQIKNKIKKLRKIVDENGYDIDIQVDGGITLDNAKEIVECGANILVVGSAIYNTEDPKSVVEKFKAL